MSDEKTWDWQPTDNLPPRVQREAIKPPKPKPEPPKEPEKK